MDNYLEIFDVLYEIKDQISDKNFVYLNEKVSEMYAEIKNFRDNNDTASDNQSDNESDGIIRAERPSRIHRYYHDSGSSISSNVSSEDEEPRPRIIIDNDSDEEYCYCNGRKNTFCSLENLKNCDNFQDLVLKNKFLKNVINEPYNILNITEVDDVYDRNIFLENVRALFKLKEIIDDENNKYLIMIAFFDYCLSNIRFLKENKNFGILVHIKLEEMLKSEENFRNLLQKFHFNENIWLESFKNASNYDAMKLKKYFDFHDFGEEEIDGFLTNSDDNLQNKIYIYNIENEDIIILVGIQIDEDNEGVVVGNLYEDEGGKIIYMEKKWSII